MTSLLLFLHLLSAFWYVMGLAAVQLAWVSASRAEELPVRIAGAEEASHYQGVLLVPGAIAAGFTGAFYWASRDYNLATTGWVLALEALYVVTLLGCLPVMGVGLRRARLAALKARRSPEVAPELDRALADSVPLVFGALATALVLAMTALSVWGP
jgi:uncharacterized membrane protein